jgi:hypothetical protein
MGESHEKRHHHTHTGEYNMKAQGKRHLGTGSYKIIHNINFSVNKFTHKLLMLNMIYNSWYFTNTF